MLEQLQETLNQPQDTIKAVTTLQEENSNLKKELKALEKYQLKALKDSLLSEISIHNGLNFLAKEVDLSASMIKDLAFELGANQSNIVIVLGSKKGGKPVLSCYISKELVTQQNLNAGTIVRELGKHIQGGGGGQPFFATAGGKNPDGIAAAIQTAKELF